MLCFFVILLPIILALLHFYGKLSLSSEWVAFWALVDNVQRATHLRNSKQLINLSLQKEANNGPEVCSYLVGHPCRMGGSWCISRHLCPLEAVQRVHIHRQEQMVVSDCGDATFRVLRSVDYHGFSRVRRAVALASNADTSSSKPTGVTQCLLVA